MFSKCVVGQLVQDVQGDLRCPKNNANGLEVILGTILAILLGGILKQMLYNANGLEGILGTILAILLGGILKQII